MSDQIKLFEVDKWSTGGCYTNEALNAGKNE